MGCLYQIEFGNGKSYIGISMHPLEKRMHWHEKASRKTSEKKGVIYSAMNKHRGDYKAKVLAVYDDWDTLLLIEKKAIVAFNTKVPNGYNMTDGGEGVQGVQAYWTGKKRAPFSEEWKEKISQGLKGNKYAIGCVHTEEGKKRMAQWGNQHAKGKSRPWSEETRAKHAGFKHTEEYKKRMSIAKKAWHEAKRIAKQNEPEHP